jgi:integrator complex subunit 11
VTGREANDAAAKKADEQKAAAGSGPGSLGPSTETAPVDEIPLKFFTSDDITRCMDRVTSIDLGQVIKVCEDLEIKCYYAGHVLGAAMFHIRSGNQSVVYTGDYNMTPDRHLGSAWIDRCKPDVLITETTYATTIRDSKRSREREFLQKIYSCVKNGGKVLIPVFALGRAQELCILIDSFWERMGLQHIPVFFSQGMTERANEYYKLFVQWTNQKIKRTFVDRNPFDFGNVRALEDRNLSFEREGPMVLFATPGMLHAGTSLEAFKKWCGDSKNMVIMPGYCVPGTVGAKVLAGSKQIDIDRWTHVTVNMHVENLSFSAHADAKGILQLIRMCEPRSVVLVHGEKNKMSFLKQRINAELGIPAFFPGNGETVVVASQRDIPGISVEAGLVEQKWREKRLSMRKMLKAGTWKAEDIKPVTEIPVQGVLEWDRRNGKRDRDEEEDGKVPSVDKGLEAGSAGISSPHSSEPTHEVFEDPEFGAFAHQLDSSLQLTDPNDKRLDATPVGEADGDPDSDDGQVKVPASRKPASSSAKPNMGKFTFMSTDSARTKHGLPPRSVENLVRKPYEVTPPAASGFTTPEVRDAILGKIASAIGKWMTDAKVVEAEEEGGKVLKIGGDVTLQVKDSDVVIGWLGPGEDEEMGERVVELVNWALD